LTVGDFLFLVQVLCYVLILFCNLVAGDSCTTIKDSKHRLQDDGSRYLAVFYSGGPDIFIQ